VQAGYEKTFSDTVSGASLSQPGIDLALSHLRREGELVVRKLDRLGRTVHELVAFAEELQRRGISFGSLTDGIETSTPAGRFLFHVMAALAQKNGEGFAARAYNGRPGSIEGARPQWRA
jgi:DNA invertase Pin-like site-specific DNA recombinase